MVERGVDFPDVRSAISRATRVTSYENGTAQQGGSCWRVLGPDLDDQRDIAVGVEVFLDKKKRRIVLVTVFEVEV